MCGIQTTAVLLDRGMKTMRRVCVIASVGQPAAMIKREVPFSDFPWSGQVVGVHVRSFTLLRFSGACHFRQINAH